MQSMKAVQIHDYGHAEVLCYEEIERPVPGRGQILIEVRAIGVNPVDWKLREGYVKDRIQLPMPCILGADVAGKLAALGEGVSGFSAGDRVYSMLGLIGAYAEYVCVDVAHVASCPDTLDFIQAASVPLAALTAWQGLFEHAALEAGQTLLVHGAAGGVGGFAVQFGRAKGAHVIATASAKNAGYVSKLGAAEVFDYRADAAERFPTEVDLVLDLVGNDVDRILTAIKPGGSLVQVAPGGSPDTADKASKAGVKTVGFQVHPAGAQLAEIATMIDSGDVLTHVDAVIPLAEVSRAHDLSQQGHTRGKIVLSCGS